MTDNQYLAKLCEKQDTTNHLLEDIYDALDTIAENLILIRKKQDADRQVDAQAAFDAQFESPVKQIDNIINCARKSFAARADNHDAVRLWADDLAERSVW